MEQMAESPTRHVGHPASGGHRGRLTVPVNGSDGAESVLDGSTAWQ